MLTAFVKKGSSVFLRNVKDAELLAVTFLPRKHTKHQEAFSAFSQLMFPLLKLLRAAPCHHPTNLLRG